MRKGLEKTAKEMLFQIAGSNMKQIERHVFLDEETNTLYPFNWTASTKQLDKGNFAEVLTSHRNTSNENCDILNYALNHNGPGFYFLFVFTKEDVKTYYTDLKNLLNFYFEGGRGCDDRFLFRISIKDALDNKETLSIISCSDITKKLNINILNKAQMNEKNNENLSPKFDVNKTKFSINCENLEVNPFNRPTDESDASISCAHRKKVKNRKNKLKKQILKYERFIKPIGVPVFFHNGHYFLGDANTRLVVNKELREERPDFPGLYDDWEVDNYAERVNPETNKKYTFEEFNILMGYLNQNPATKHTKLDKTYEEALKGNKKAKMVYKTHLEYEQYMSETSLEQFLFNQAATKDESGDVKLKEHKREFLNKYIEKLTKSYRKGASSDAKLKNPQKSWKKVSLNNVKIPEKCWCAISTLFEYFHIAKLDDLFVNIVCYGFEKRKMSLIGTTVATKHEECILQLVYELATDEQRKYMYDIHFPRTTVELTTTKFLKEGYEEYTRRNANSEKQITVNKVA